jgi:hypothetical protein
MTFSAGWITAISPLPPPGGGAPKGAGDGIVTYAVGANSGGPRTGSVSVGGQTHAVTQQGFSCADTISPTFASPSSVGGNINVSVTAPKGCSWTAVSNVAWVTIKSGASGSGGGTVVLSVAPQAGASRSGTVTIAGQTFSITEGAGDCGAVDVTSQIGTYKSGLTYIWESSYEYSEYISVINISLQTVPGPIYLALLGLPNHQPPPNGNNLLSGGVLTTCFSPQGDYLMPVSRDSMTPGASIIVPLLLSTDSLGGSLGYTIKVLSGLPN